MGKQGRRSTRWLWHARVRAVAVTVSVICLAVGNTILVSAPQATYAAPQAGPVTSHAGKQIRRRSDPEGEAAWFQLSHFGKQQPPANALIKARQQANLLPLTAGDWSPLGPQPIDTTQCAALGNCTNWSQTTGRVTALAVNPAPAANGQDVWAGAAGGGVWHSTDGGTTWTQMTDYLQFTNSSSTTEETFSIGAIAIDPSTTQSVAQTVYAGTGEANNNLDNYPGSGILKTTNGGQTWNLYGDSTFGVSASHIARIAVNPANPNYVLVAADRGIYFSNDGGQTWPTATLTAGTGGTDVVYDPANPSIAFAGMSGTVTRNSVGTLTVTPVWMNTNYGQGDQSSWVPLDLGLAANTEVDRTSLAISPDGTRLYAVLVDQNRQLTNGDIFTYDVVQGIWRAYYTNLDMATDGNASPPNHNRSQWNYESAVAVDPTSNGATVYVGGVDLWQSTDNGVDWTNLTAAYGPSPSIVHPDQHAIAFLPGSSSFYLGNDGGIWKATNSGPSGTPAFSNLNRGGLNITQFYAGSAGMTGPDAVLYGGAQDNGEVQYPSSQLSSEATWNAVVQGDGGDTVVDYTNNAIVYEEGTYGSINKSSDGGQNWTSATNGIMLCPDDSTSNCTPKPNVNFVMPFVMSPRTHTTLFAGTTQVYETTDGASTWSPLTSFPMPNPNNKPPHVLALAVAPSSDSDLYASDTDGNVWATTNGGLTWTGGPMNVAPAPPTGAMVTGLAVDLTNPSIVYATLNGFTFAGTGGRVYRSIDGGSSWKDISISPDPTKPVLPNIPFESVVVNPNNDANIIVASDVGVFSSADSGQTWSRLGSALPNVVVDQVFTDRDGTQLFAATHGRGMWTLSLAAPTHAYFATSNTGAGQTNQIYALNTASGLVSWSYPTSTTNGPTALYNGIVYIAGESGGGIYALNAPSGTLLWHYPFSGNVSGLTPDGGTIIFGGSDGNLYALDGNTGALVWKVCLCSTKGGPYPVGVPIVAGSTVYVHADSTYVYALSASTGAKIWSYNLRTGQPGNPAYGNGLLYVPVYTPGKNGAPGTATVLALNATSGQSVWTYTYVGTTSPGELGDIAFANGLVYFGSINFQLVALNASTGAQAWRVGLSNPNEGCLTNAVTNLGIPVIVNGTLYIGLNSEVDAYNASTGAQLWYYQTCDGFLGSPATPVVASGFGYAADSDAGVTALNLNSGSPLWHGPGQISNQCSLCESAPYQYNQAVAVGP